MHIQGMTPSEHDRRKRADRRLLLDQRSDVDRRVESAPLPVERRGGEDRRETDRRVGVERRLALQSAASQVHIALALLMRIAESDALGDENLRLLDAAMLRLRFAAERMEQE